ncbi:hypothetical protein ACE6H2_012560 [Prunus campanulata]
MQRSALFVLEQTNASSIDSCKCTANSTAELRAHSSLKIRRFCDLVKPYKASKQAIVVVEILRAWYLLWRTRVHSCNLPETVGTRLSTCKSRHFSSTLSMGHVTSY